MAIERDIRGQSYVFEVDYGEELDCARIIVRCSAGGPEGLYFVYADGSMEPAKGRGGFGPNPAHSEGIWPQPPAELIADARRIAQRKTTEDD
jgi:hypothetical protein